jgi:hypothetical protein
MNQHIDYPEYLFNNKVICVDFDGVIHKYSKRHAWSDFYDGPTEGCKEALETWEDYGYTIVIFTAREKCRHGEIKDWLKKYGFKEYEITNHKITALLYLDDRAEKYEGPHTWTVLTNRLCGPWPVEQSKQALIMDIEEKTQLFLETINTNNKGVPNEQMDVLPDERSDDNDTSFAAGYCREVAPQAQDIETLMMAELMDVANKHGFRTHGTVSYHMKHKEDLLLNPYFAKAVFGKLVAQCVGMLALTEEDRLILKAWEHRRKD